MTPNFFLPRLFLDPEINTWNWIQISTFGTHVSSIAHLFYESVGFRVSIVSDLCIQASEIWIDKIKIEG